MTDAATPPDLRLRQRSMWTAFPLDLLNAAGQVLGALDWPDGEAGLPRAALPLRLQGRRLHITQAAVAGGWTSGRRLQLCGPDGAVQASLDIQVGAPRRQALLQLSAPVAGQVVAMPVRGRMAFAVQLADGRQGSVQEPAWLSLRRSLDVRLPRSDDALRAFLGAAVLIARTSHSGIRW